MTSVGCTLPPSASSVADARRFVEQALEGWGLEAAAWTARQLVSELATNAVLHARTTFQVEVHREDGVVRISVCDSSSLQVGVRRYGTQSTTGRGLRLVESMSVGWGVEVLPAGKAVWFTLPATGPGTAQAWDDGSEVDLDALLASYDDGSSSG